MAAENARKALRVLLSPRVKRRARPLAASWGSHGLPTAPGGRAKEAWRRERGPPATRAVW